MSFLKYLIAALLLLSSAAYAADPGMPPQRFDHPYDGEVIPMQMSTQQRLQNFCEDMGAKANGSNILACSFIRRGRCYIFSVPEKDIEAWGYSLNTVMRHERAHCNGWPPDHPR